MKKINALLGFLLLLAIIFACENDGGESKIKTIDGAVVSIQKTENTDSFIDLTALENGEDINLGITISEALGEVKSLNIVGFYVKKDGSISKGIIFKDIQNFPSKINITKTDLILAFSNVSSVNDFKIGDQIIISADITLKNGQILALTNNDGTSNYSTNIATSGTYKVTQSYNVSCPSNLGGSYAFTTTNVSAPTGEFEAGPITGTVTFTDLGGGQYALSDASFGGWGAIYGAGEIAVGVGINDICNTINFTGKDQYDEVFTFSNLQINGATLTFKWENDYGEFGTTSLVRTDGTNWPNLKL